MNEFELIARLTRSLPTNPNVVVGAGDDCAVLDLGLPGKVLLFKTDAVVEGIHFEKDSPPEKIGRKALARCLSDIAAMAGTAEAAVVTIGLPDHFKPKTVEGIYGGLGELARKHGVAIVGGETTSNPERTIVSVALIGTVPQNRQVLRSNAKAGDAIFVTGELGGSAAGKHLDFEPRLTEACWLAEHFSIHAMIDLSDGLAGDLRHILNASQVGAELLKSAIPISRAAKERARSHPRENMGDANLPYSHGHRYKTAFAAALTDGEDFELLFTVRASDAVKLLDAWKKEFPKLKLSCIGKIVAGTGITLCDKSGSHKLDVRGYEHFEN